MKEKKKSAAVKKENNPASASLLFYEKPTVLEKNRHAKAGVSSTSDFSFARNTNSIALSAVEFIEAARCYPIVFTDGEVPAPVALVGLEQANYFVDATGAWREDAYIPAYVRQYPFVFFERQEDQTFFLCVDEAAAHYQAEVTDENTRFFNDAGEPTEMTNHALQFCTAFYQHHHVTRQFCTDLKAMGLLETYQSQIQFPSGRQTSLSNFLMINETAFNALSAEDFLTLRSKGWLPFIYLALTSGANWKRLVALG